ncbi:S-adenosyl-L-methionine-dependent methyltransferases superfamily protein [Tasmannia lanceolata]|uniref:S-adenosyl-L-methionine-dependent methyltransferases superfamily protein n=1 Tax=Tasmannia lanceolata TaxID=3420 RepID=UPI004064A126
MMESNECLSSPSLHLISAFFAMEPTDCLISLARESGGGLITKGVQSFIWEHCFKNVAGKSNAPTHLYAKRFLKKVIDAVESSCHDVLDSLYEQYAYYMTSSKDDNLLGTIGRVYKRISFLFPNGFSKDKNFPRSMKVVVPLQCALNMLEGDTGCSIWPSSLYLSEFILSYPETFSNKSCFEVGSGVGLVGIALTHANASKIILSDGDLSSLANMKLNLEMNQLSAETKMSQRTFQYPNLVECKYMPWESVSESELQQFKPDIVLGADVIYDPLCFPHLIRVLATLLNPNKFNPHQGKESCSNSGGHRFGTHEGQISFNDTPTSQSEHGASKEGPVAYIATVIRNVETFNYFLRLADEAHLNVVDITETRKPLNLLPYMLSYDRSSIHLYTVSFSCN